MNKKPTAVASRGFVEIFILATTSTLGIGGYYYPGYQNYQRLSDLQEHFGKNTNGTAEVKEGIQLVFKRPQPIPEWRVARNGPKEREHRDGLPSEKSFFASLLHC